MKRDIIIAVAVLVGFATSGHTSILVNVPAYDVGRYSSAGDHSAVNRNYMVGQVGGVAYAGFAVFNVAKLSKSVESTTTTTSSSGSWSRRPDLDASPLLPPPPLGVANPYAWEWSGLYKETYTVTKSEQHPTGSLVTIAFSNPGTKSSDSDALVVHDVSTPAAQLTAGGTGKAAIYADLSGGTEFGSIVPPTGPFSFPLNADAGAAFAALADLGGIFALGFSLPGADDGEFVFGYTGTPPIGVTLGATVELSQTDFPPASTTWERSLNSWVNPETGEPLFSVPETWWKANIWYTATLDEPSFAPVPEPLGASLASALVLLGLALRRRIVR